MTLVGSGGGNGEGRQVAQILLWQILTGVGGRRRGCVVLGLVLECVLHHGRGRGRGQDPQGRGVRSARATRWRAALPPPSPGGSQLAGPTLLEGTRANRSFACFMPSCQWFRWTAPREGVLVVSVVLVRRPRSSSIVLDVRDNRP